jgi:hypothetical protein
MSDSELRERLADYVAELQQEYRELQGFQAEEARVMNRIADEIHRRFLQAPSAPDAKARAQYVNRWEKCG